MDPHPLKRFTERDTSRGEKSFAPTLVRKIQTRLPREAPVTRITGFSFTSFDLLSPNQFQWIVNHRKD
ncbi:MAG: hypothetical protein COS92_06245 [Desulfobacterales bacterium CG07_land_8_20_14_0_80_52_14]|nr:MAG: hypothetical protein COX20_04860 [Desulfobacterales bacterium CG23_combo_of_CG06-09_8_20_14_all_52_9]PIU49545.1 MAG: hypothetical protein COS92_06245 [Desulfobacterales bacterium CG07_land_8_20_14_0_80_52_14]